MVNESDTSDDLDNDVIGVIKIKDGLFICDELGAQVSVMFYFTVSAVLPMSSNSSEKGQKVKMTFILFFLLLGDFNPIGFWRVIQLKAAQSTPKSPA